MCIAEEKKRQVILIASELFDRLGYERTSMAAIAARTGESTTGLSNYFACKEELFRAVLDHRVEEESACLLDEFLAERDVGSGLIRLGMAYQEGRRERSAAMRSAADNPIARKFYESIRRRVWQRLAERFAEMVGNGELRFGNPARVSLLRSARRRPAKERPGRPDCIASAAAAAAEAFLQAYPPAVQPADISR